ncbi:hypothetical protein ABH926_003758 [Catenulispora sp. GP43]|uniref:effector-associated constant component EACC1 n=1 Tax=Catenulispora sp. GP43 TaxID=3156263 RepID=UPI003511DD24
MGSRTATAVIEVSGDDALRSEDATRALSADLAAVQDVTVRLEYAGGTPRAGAKGPGAEVLHAVVDYAWPAAAPLVAEAVKKLCSRHKRERVRVSIGPNYVEISGDPSEEQAKLLSEVLGELQR